MSSPSSLSTKIPATTNDILSIYTTANNQQITTGVQNSTGNYVIGTGNALNTPLLTVQPDGTVVVENDLVVKGNNTLINSNVINFEAPAIDIGLSQGNITFIKQIQNTAFTNYQEYAVLNFEGGLPPNLSSSNAVFSGIYVNNVLSENYNKSYPPTSVFNNSSISTIPDTNSAHNITFTNTDAVYTDLTSGSSIFANTPITLLTSLPLRIYSTVSSSSVTLSNVSSNSLTVSNINGFSQSGTLLIRNSSAIASLVSSSYVIDEYTLQMTINVGSTINIGDYLAGTDGSGHIYVLGSVQAITNGASGSKNIKFNNMIAISTISGGITTYTHNFTTSGSIYPLITVSYGSISGSTFGNVLYKGSNPLSLSSGNQVYSFSTVSPSTHYYIGSNSDSSGGNSSLTCIPNDTTYSSLPAFDNSPSDLQLLLTSYCVWKFDSSCINNLSLTTVNGTMGLMQPNTYNDGLYNMTFHFTDASNNDVSKSISCGNTNTDTLYFTKNDNGTRVPYFTFDYADESFAFNNGSKIKNSTEGVLNIISTSQNIGDIPEINISAGSGGINMNSNTTVNGNLNVSGIITASGSGFNVSTAADFTQGVAITSGTHSSSTTSGALTVSGGIGISDNVNIGTTLNVGNSASITGALSTSSTLSVGSSASITGAATVGGILTTNQSLSVGTSANIGGSATVGGALSTNSTLAVTGSATVGGALSTSSTLAVTGAATVTGALIANNTLAVSGAATVGGSAAITGALSTSSTLAVTGAATITGALIANNTLAVSGAATVGGSATVTGALIGNSTLAISGAATVGGSATITGALLANNTLAVSGAATVGGSATITGHLVANNTLAVTGAATVDGALSTTSTLAVSGAATVGGSATITGALMANNTLAVSGAATVGGSATITGALSTSSTLAVSGAATVGGSATITGALIANNTLAVNSSATVGGALIASSTLAVTGAATITGALSTSSTLAVSGAATVGGSATITGALIGDSTLAVTGAATVGGSATITGALSTSSTLAVGSSATITGNTTIAGQTILSNSTNSTTNSSGALTVAGGVGIQQDMYVGGNINAGTINSVGQLSVNSGYFTVDASGDIVTSGTQIINGGFGNTSLTTAGGAIIGGGLTVAGQTNLNGPINMGNNTDSTGYNNGAVIVTGGVGISKNLNVHNNVNIGGASNLAGNLTVGTTIQNANITNNGNMSVSGSSIVTGLITTNTGISVTNGGNNFTVDSSGDTVIAGTVNITNSGSSALNVTGSSTLQTLSVNGLSTINRQMTISDSTSCTSSTTGALLVAGGVGIGGSLNVNTDIVSAHGLKVGSRQTPTFYTATDGTTIITNATDYNGSGQSGALQVAGGAWFGESVSIGMDAHIAGTLYATQTTTVSDKRLKENVVLIDNPLDKVMAMRGVYFDWIDKEKYNDKNQIGFIAQEVEAVCPQLVVTKEDGFKSVNYSQTVSLLVEAIKEQQDIINQLRADMDELKNKKPRTYKKKTVV